MKPGDERFLKPAPAETKHSTTPERVVSDHVRICTTGEMRSRIQHALEGHVKHGAALAEGEAT